MKLAVLYLSLLTAVVFTQEEEFKCPAFTKLSDKIHLFPDSAQCDKYFECRNGLAKRVVCQDGLVFHPEKPEGEDPCDLKHNTPDKCKTRPELQRPKPGDSHCPRQNGVYPSEDPFECDVFYSCLNGVGSPTRCAEGLHFSEDIGTCVWARESGRAGCVSEQNRSQKKMTDKKPADDTPTTQKPKSLENGFTCPGGALGVHPALPHPTSCRQYYICLDGITATEAGCTKGRVFNPGTQQCDSPPNVPGCEDFYDEKAKQKKVELADSLGTNVGDKDFSKFLTLLKMSGVLKEGAQLDAVLQGQSLSKEDSGSRDTAPNTRPGRPGRRGPGRRPGGRNRPNRRRPNRPRPALFNDYDEDEYDDYEDYEDEKEEEDEEEKITTLAPEPAASSRPENSLFPSRSKTSFAERFRPKVNLVNASDNKKKFETAEDEKSMIANEDASAANAAELDEKPRRNPFSKPEKSSRTEPTKSVGLMTLSGPDAEALFQSLIRDDPSAVGVVDTTTPPPSIQPTSSLESTTQEQRLVQQPRALSRKFLFPRPRGLIQEKEDKAEEIVEEEDVKDEAEVEEEENVRDEEVVESRTSDDKRPTLPGRSSFRNNFFRGKGRPSRPPFFKAEEPTEDEENTSKEQLIQQEEEKEEEDEEEEDKAEEEEVTFSKPSNFRASMSKSKLRESIRKSVDSQKNSAPEINEIEPRTESTNFKLLVTPHPAIEEPEEVTDSEPDTHERPAVVRGIKRKRPSFVRPSFSETTTENNNEISTEGFEDVTDLPEPSAPVRRIKGKGRGRKEQTRTQDSTPIPKPLNNLQKLFQPKETTVSEPISEPTLPSVESRGETILAAVVSLSSTSESPEERGQNLLASISREPAENPFSRFNTAGSRFPVFAATPAPVPRQSSFVSSSNEELPISSSSSFSSVPVLSPQTSSSFSSAPSGNFFAQFPTSPSLDTQNFQRISFPGVPAVPSGVPAAPVGVPAAPRGTSLSRGLPQVSSDFALVNRESAQSRQPLPFTSFTQNPPSTSPVRDFQTSFREEESPHVALPFLQREDDSLQGAATPVRDESNFLRGQTQFTAFRDGQARSVFQPSSSSQGRTLFQTNIADQARTVSTPELGGQLFQPSQVDQGRFSTQTFFQNSGSSFPFPSLFDQGSGQSAPLAPIQQTQSQFRQTPNRFTARNQFSSTLPNAASFQLSPTLAQSPFQTALQSIPTRQFVNRRAEDLEDDPMQIVAERLRTRLSSVMPEAANEGDALEILREKVNRSKNANRARG